MYHQISTKNYLPERMPEGSQVRTAVRDIIPNVEKSKLYRGKGGEIMRNGVCHLIKAMSIANLDFKTEDGQGSLLPYFFEQLQENFKHPNAEI